MLFRSANDTEFGLVAYFYICDLGRSIRVAEALDYGMIESEERRVGKECRSPLWYSWKT